MTDVAVAQTEPMVECGELYFRVLDYYFSVEVEDPVMRPYLLRVLGGFEVPPDPFERRLPPTPNMPPCYRIVPSDDADDRFDLLYGSDAMLTKETTAEVLNRVFWHVNNEAIRRTGSYLLVHAGVVCTDDGRAVVIPAAGGSGKSTLVAGLVRAGFGYLTDEAAAIDPVTGMVHPFPKALTVKPGSYDALPGLRPSGSPLEQHQWHVPAEELRPGAAVSTAANPTWVVGVNYSPPVDTVLTPRSRAETLYTLGQQTLNLHLYRHRALPILRRLTDVASGHFLTLSDLASGVAAVQELTAC
jgi:hypothetical protein